MKCARIFVSMALFAMAFPPLCRVAADDELARRSSWEQPSVQEVKAEVYRWAAGRGFDRLTQAKLAALWPKEGANLTGEELLARLATTFSLQMDSPEIDQVQRLIRLCQGEPPAGKLPQFSFLDDEKTSPWVRNNLRLYYGRWLASNRYYEEAGEQLAGIEPKQVVDPASLLFHQSVVHHYLLDKQNCLATIDRLRENEATIPRRYAQLARLMESDIRGLRTDSLDEIARLMKRIENDLQLGRAGTRVRHLEADVIAKIDNLIEQHESDGPHPGPRPEDPSPPGPPRPGPKHPGQPRSGDNPVEPMDDSGHATNRGRGDVDRRGIGKHTDWGNLNPRERQRILQQMHRDLPAHDRAVIEAYFRKLARDVGK